MSNICKCKTIERVLGLARGCLKAMHNESTRLCLSVLCRLAGNQKVQSVYAFSYTYEFSIFFLCNYENLSMLSLKHITLGQKNDFVQTI